MSFREKSAWICLVTTLVVFVPYFTYVFNLLFASRDHAVWSYLGAFIVAVVWQIILNVGAHIYLALRGGDEPKDERDVAIEAKAYRNAYLVLIGLAWTVPFVALPVAAAGRPGAPLLMGQLLLLSFVLAEAAKYLTQVFYYRRGL